jgi:hypothetical protein
MKQLVLNIFAFSVLFAAQINSQQFSVGSPEWLVDMFFVKSSFPDKANYFHGEMLNEINEPTIGEELNGKGEVAFRQIKTADFKAVFAVEIKLEEKTIDFYCYLIKHSDGWKINAVRRFLLPHFVYSVRDSLSNLNSLSSNDSTFLLSLKLFTMTDAELKKFFNTEKENFQSIVTSFNKGSGDQVDKGLAEVGCNAIYSDKKYPGCIFIQILKFEKMETGFIQAANEVLLPEISPEEFNYIDEVSPGWFIYRLM